MPSSKLFYGDNLEVLRTHFGPECVDLIYLDPPYNSNRAYNVIFDSKGDAAAQIQAFDDTWRWTSETQAEFDHLTIGGGLPPKLARYLESTHAVVGSSDLMAYLVNMAPRLLELHRCLKKSGSLYIHCDPTASHYLKMLLDAIFGPLNFRNEITWRRTGSHAPRKSFGPIHDTILFYTKTNSYFFNVLRKPYTRKHVETRYTEQADGRWKFTSGGNVLTGPGAGRGESSKPWRGFDPAAKHRHWAIPGFVTEQMPPEFETLGTLDKLDKAFEAGLLDIVEGNAWPTPVRYLRPGDGTPIGDIWCYEPGTEGVLAGTSSCIDQDVAYLGPTDPERLGFQTQKPRGLLERIIHASCPEDGVVLDPFCGCGTTLDAASHLGRTWIGIDITYIAIDLIRNRLRTTFGEDFDGTYEVLGVPADLAAAHALFDKSPFDFERWAVSLVRGTPNEKQVGDRGVDGIVRFMTGRKSSKTVVVSVKGGRQLNPAMVRDLEGVVAKTADAEIGLLVTLHTPTKGMRDAAATSGSWNDHFGNGYPKIQLLTIEDLLAGVRAKLPPVLVPPYLEARRRPLGGEEQLALEIEDMSELTDE